MSDPQQPIWNGDDAAATGHRPDVTRRIFPKLTIYSGEHARLAPRFRFFRGPAPFPDRDWEASSTMVRLLATARRPTDKLIRLPDLRSIRKKKRPFWIEPFFLFFRVTFTLTHLDVSLGSKVGLLLAWVNRKTAKTESNRGSTDYVSQTLRKKKQLEPRLVSTLAKLEISRM